MEIKPLVIAVGLQRRSIDKIFPFVSSRGCSFEMSVCDMIEQRACSIVDLNPFCNVVDFHSQAYFVKRCVPIRSKFRLFFCQTFKPVIHCVGYFICPVRGVVVKITLQKKTFTCYSKLLGITVARKVLPQTSLSPKTNKVNALCINAHCTAEMFSLIHTRVLINQRLHSMHVI